MSLEKLKRLDGRLALLVKLALDGTKPISQVTGFEGPDEVVAKMIRELGLEVEMKKAGCRTDLLFGRGLARYHEAEKLRGAEKVEAIGLALGYPRCCARYFAGFLDGVKKEKPTKMPPLEHFVCPGCRESGKLKEKYEKAKLSISPYSCDKH